MIKINLLPEEEAQKVSAQQKKIVAGLAGGIVFIILMGYYGFQALQVKRLKSNIAKTSEELAQLEPIVRQVDALEVNRTNLQNRRNVIVGLLNGRLLYPKLMEEVTSLLPKDVWLLSFRTTPEGGGLRLEFSAKSFNNYAIADWVMFLETNPHFRDVDLKTITTNIQNKKVVMDFSLSCLYTGS